MVCFITESALLLHNPEDCEMLWNRSTSQTRVGSRPLRRALDRQAYVANKVSNAVTGELAD